MRDGVGTPDLREDVSVHGGRSEGASVRRGRLGPRSWRRDRRVQDQERCGSENPGHQAEPRLKEVF
jgi:hypothetical protein